MNNSQLSAARISAALCLVLLLATMSYSGVRPGIKLGLASATFHENGTTDWSWRTAPAVGVVLDLPLADGWSLQPQLLFVTKGGRMYARDEYGYYDLLEQRFTHNLRFLELPVLVKYEFTTDGAARPYLLAGFSFGLAVYSSIETVTMTADYGDFGGVNRYTSTAKIARPPIPIDYGPAFGIGTNYHLARGSLSVEFLYLLGMNSARGFSIEKRRTKTALLLVGYAFGSAN